MLNKIKRNLFKIFNDQGDELSINEESDSFDLEFTAQGALWFFRYDCIVAAEFPQMALTLNPRTQVFYLEVF